MTALSQKVASSKHELTSQEIGNALFGLQGMRANVWETRVLVLQMAVKIQLSHSLIDPQVSFLLPYPSSSSSSLLILSLIEPRTGLISKLRIFI
jgi:hypothetical protein